MCVADFHTGSGALLGGETRETDRGMSQRGQGHMGCEEVDSKRTTCKELEDFASACYSKISLSLCTSCDSFYFFALCFA